ncbi:MAG: flagellin, partial [Candidatus Wallbacteria bacterium]|nr:flagellin [Candidatus Wallbacteria bacterium]
MVTYDRRLNVSVETQVSAERAITTIDNALNMVSSSRSRLGAVQNSLEHSFEYLQLSYELGPESQIRDADMAQEMTEMTKLSIMIQAGTAMLAQDRKTV